MRLVSFTAKNYRSIGKAEIPIRESTILIGPNNEGKSNLLRALVTALSIVSRRRPILGDRRLFHRVYDWEDDYPVALQKKRPKGHSSFRLEFKLNESEVEEFRAEVKSALNGTLPIELKLGKEGLDYRVVKRGRGGPALSKKQEMIAHFLGNRLDFQYVPAVRTAEAAEGVVEDIVERELWTLEEDPKYQAALAEIVKIQAPLLKQISDSIQETLQEFLPAVQAVSVELSKEKRHLAFRRACRIVVDDGTPTELRHKGDGVQSLAALSLMRHATERGARGRDLVLAMEEPESHLHPRAIHRLRSVVEEMASKHQVIISSHCPLFVDRRDIRSNIIVTKSKAQPAHSIEEIRDILGVKAADNLQHAELVLLVEGEDDKLAWEAVLGHRSPTLRRALSSARLVIDSLGGGSNVAYKVGLVRDAICAFHLFLDHDQAGKDGFEAARRAGLVDDADCNFAIAQGQKESEVEDLYEPKLYADFLKNKYGVMVTGPRFKSAKKWSVRLMETFRQQGRQWSDRVEMDVKAGVAELVAAEPAKALLPAREDVAKGLIEAIKNKLG